MQDVQLLQILEVHLGYTPPFLIWSDCDDLFQGLFLTLISPMLSPPVVDRVSWPNHRAQPKRYYVEVYDVGGRFRGIIPCDCEHL